MEFLLIAGPNLRADFNRHEEGYFLSKHKKIKTPPLRLMLMGHPAYIGHKAAFL